MESFIEYMWYLFTSPFKKVKKTLNHWYTLCKVCSGKDLMNAKKTFSGQGTKAWLQPVAMRCSRYTQQTET